VEIRYSFLSSFPAFIFNLNPKVVWERCGIVERRMGIGILGGVEISLCGKRS